MAPAARYLQEQVGPSATLVADAVPHLSSRTKPMTRLQDETPPSLQNFGREAGVAGAHVVQLEVVEAASHPDFTEYFFRRQHACYSRFRSEAAAAPHQTRNTWKGVYLIVATDHTNGEIAGGVGVFERHPDAPMPVELAIGDSPQLQWALSRWEHERVVELSGLWVEEHWRRTGLSNMLMLVAMSAAREHKASKAVGFSHQHVLDFYQTIGLVPDHSVGDYHYPDHKYVSTFIWGDLRNLTTAPTDAKDLIEKFGRSLRTHRDIVWKAIPRQRQTAQPAALTP